MGISAYHPDSDLELQSIALQINDTCSSSDQILVVVDRILWLAVFNTSCETLWRRISEENWKRLDKYKFSDFAFFTLISLFVLYSDNPIPWEKIPTLWSSAKMFSLSHTNTLVVQICNCKVIIAQIVSIDGDVIFDLLQTNRDREPTQCVETRKCRLVIDGGEQLPSTTKHIRGKNSELFRDLLRWRKRRGLMTALVCQSNT